MAKNVGRVRVCVFHFLFLFRTVYAIRRLLKQKHWKIIYVVMVTTFRTNVTFAVVYSRIHAGWNFIAAISTIKNRIQFIDAICFAWCTWPILFKKKHFNPFLPHTYSPRRHHQDVCWKLKIENKCFFYNL